MCFDPLRAACLPSLREAGIVVIGEFISFHQNIVALAYDANLSVIVNAVLQYLHFISGSDAGAMIPPNLAILNYPIRAERLGAVFMGIDRSELRRNGIFFNDESANRDVCRTPHKRMARDTGLHLVPSRAIGEVNFVGIVIKIPFARPHLA
jgi:hypothetical protein